MRLYERLTRSFQAPVTVHNYPSSHVYLFRNGRSDPDESSEEESDFLELRPRGKEQQKSNSSQERAGDVVLLERELTKDDNLNKLALQYGCKVADIKRVNNFICEQDLYALKSIKIPVKAHGVLTETSKELKPPQNAPSQAGMTLIELPESDDGATSSSYSESRYLTDYFKGIDQTIEDVVQSKVHLNADFCIETPNCSPSSSVGQKEPNNGADCGIQWWNAVFIMLLIGIVLPVFYIVYFKTQQTGSAAHTSNTTFASNSSAHELGGTLLQHLPVVKTHTWKIQSSTASPPNTDAHKPVTLTPLDSGG
ncbi:lysM and putative peptidoglycan-binding domain-containing protein 4 [Dermochelys coriacea]|uniref:lysM and putative peptidoglycan-binding domain-containing protein 4 n=1 Tax=Dermochelys coriacea TaxID=27794 RepID=UPI0018E8673A|nr:lysM and putative peptidoglycan-binding domain-containing protein 4 [Dermochelys coriacea]XP_038276595.1 lysM and putative peptidoglycan-binding domain-containing protein 4 [Dermochelys coriacea]XP_038276596.1 lysM and putative peptidoglycan-binding domain-containing protein 4 [Dermochelys coriacea]XP_043350515.1 lysM and putative peptidoglycan-binding domain-containing protein 4 [Dermochelys coriacea]